MSGTGRVTPRRSYRPVVEALEALRLLDAAPAMPEVMVDREVSTLTAAIPGPTAWEVDAAWDAALGQTRLAELLEVEATPEDVEAGLAQLDRYLGRAWYRAGIDPQRHDDCTQAVYVSLLQNLGRDRFDRLSAEVGRVGIREVLSRETAEGPDFFRAIDTIKKRAQRERSYQPLEGVDVAAPAGAESDPWEIGGALREVMARRLSPREADLIDATLKGETPAEIAERWGVAPKTVSNEKTRALHKLREALVAEMDD